MLVRLLYASKSDGSVDDTLLDAILSHSRGRNVEHGITGVLCVYREGGVFMQALEGAREEVNALYNNLVRDERHGDVTLLLYEEIRERRFASWRMGVVDLKKINPSTILRFSERLTVDPFSMSGTVAQAFIEELAATAAVMSQDRS